MQRKPIFMHIPKAAGSTFKSILWRNYGNGKVYDFWAPTMRIDLDKFFDMPSDERESYQAVQGHVPFGLQQYLGQEWTYVTLIREPVARLVSTYNFILYNKKHPEHERFLTQNLSFNDFIDITESEGRL